ncbi:uncharacterized protein [Euwallacea similis]|uniref:uncharacterized protein n=1 Tax=Euwallacea similis TaxID=1736056 RepID=UPI00344CFFE1
MQKPKSEVRTDDGLRSQKSHYTNVSKIDSVSSKNLELSLEVEIDEEVRSIIRNPTKCPSTLDVTVIEPKGTGSYSINTQTLKTEQVKKLIGAMRLENNDKKVLMQKLFGEIRSRKKKPENDHKEDRKSKHMHRNSLGTQEVPSYSRKEPPTTKVQHIFTTLKTYKNIRAMFDCSNVEHEDQRSKMNQPCLCQNCAIVGILTDSLKKPFATEPMSNLEEKQEPKFKRLLGKKSVGYKNLKEIVTGDNSHEQYETLFKLLSMRIDELEKRVLMQEKKAVPKDYFRKIITKLVNHFSKLTQYTTARQPSQRDNEYRATRSKSKTNSKYYVNPAPIRNPYKLSAEKEYEPKPCSSSESHRGPSETLWKWGEEVLVSGRDLKNRVVFLFEETLKYMKKGWEKSPEITKRYEDDIQSILNELSKNLTKTVNLEVLDDKEGRKGRDARGSMGIGGAIKEDETRRKMAQPLLITRYRRTSAPSVKLAYINPQLMKWPEESSVSLKIDSSDDHQNREKMTDSRNTQYKKEFCKVLNNTKFIDKYRLWQTVWSQAQENRQTTADTVIIQIPDPKDPLRHKMLHLECTIGELEQILFKDQFIGKN